MKKGIDYPGITVSFLCHDGKGNFLMNKRSVNCRDEHGCWDPGGGGLELGQTVESALKEEIVQEYCTEVFDYEFLGYRDVHREHEGTKTHWIALDFKVRIDKSNVENGEPHKLEELQWFPINEIQPRQKLHSQLPYFLEQHKERLRL